MAGINGAIVAPDCTEIESPGAVSAVPEPGTYVLMLGWRARFKRQNG